LSYVNCSLTFHCGLHLNAATCFIPVSNVDATNDSVMQRHGQGEVWKSRLNEVKKTVLHCSDHIRLINNASNVLVVPHFIFETQERVPTAKNVVVVVEVFIVIRFLKFQDFFISQPIVLKIWLQLGDNILNFCTVSDF